jgi:hypothetical protein
VVGACCSRRPGDEPKTWHRVVGAQSSSSERASARGTGTKKQSPPPNVSDMAPTSESAITLEVDARRPADTTVGARALRRRAVGQSPDGSGRLAKARV